MLNEVDETISVFQGDGDGNLKEYQKDGGGVRFHVGSLPRGLSSQDVNNDGHPDLIIGNSLGHCLELLGDGHGGFAVRFDRQPAVGLAIIEDPAAKGGFSVVLTNTDGGNEGQIAIGESGARDALEPIVAKADERFAPSAVEVVDLDHDGEQDILVVDRGGNRLLVYRGLTEGGFAEEPDIFPVGTNPAALAVADLNRDGRADVAVANAGCGNISILLGQAGNGLPLLRTGPRLQLADDFRPLDVEVADYTDDGLLDLLVTAEHTANGDREDPNGKVFLLPGLGHGFFDDRTPRSYETGSQPQQVLVGDFDGDRRVDLVTVNIASNDLTVVYGLADTTDPHQPRTQSIALSNIATFGHSQVRAAVTYLHRNDFQDSLFVANADHSVFLLDSDADGFTKAIRPVERTKDSNSVTHWTTETIKVLAPTHSSCSDDLVFVLAGRGDDNLAAYDVMYSSYPQTSSSGSTFATGADGDQRSDIGASVNIFDTPLAPRPDSDKTGGEPTEGETRQNLKDQLERLLQGMDGNTRTEPPDIDRPPSNPDDPPPEPSFPWGDLLFKMAVGAIQEIADDAQQAAYWATEEILVAMELPIAPETVQDLFIAAYIDLRQRIAQVNSLPAGERRPLESGQAMRLAVGDWWELHREFLASWLGPPAFGLEPPTSPVPPGDGFRPHIADESGRLVPPKDHRRPTNPRLPTPTPPGDRYASTLDPDYATWAIVGTLAISSLAVGIHRLGQTVRSRHRSGTDEDRTSFPVVRGIRKPTSWITESSPSDPIDTQFPSALPIRPMETTAPHHFGAPVVCSGAGCAIIRGRTV